MRKHLAPEIVAVCFLLLPALLYFGAYYAMVDYAPYRICLGGRATCYPTYQTETLWGLDTERFFAPAHYVDRELLRPWHWVQPTFP